jgi:putative flippase GtrA
VSPSAPDRTEEWRRGGRFLVVGLANTVVTYAIFVVLGLLIPPEVAYTVAFLVGLLWVSLGTSRFVFRSRGRPWRIVSFAAVYLVMYAIGRVIVELLAPADLLSLMVASIAIIAVTTPLAYVAGRFIFPAEPESG